MLYNETPGRSNRPSPGRPRGNRPNAPRPPAGRPIGNRPNANRPNAPRPSTGRPIGNRPLANRPNAPRPPAGRPMGNRPRANRPNAPRPPAGRPRGVRPPGNMRPGYRPPSIRVHDHRTRGGRPVGYYPYPPVVIGPPMTGGYPGQSPTGGCNCKPCDTKPRVCHQLENFELDKSELSPDHITQLKSIANEILNTGINVIKITGFADPSGTDQHNLKLGGDRARNTRIALRNILHEIKPFSIFKLYFLWKSKGESVQITGTHAKNRRVKICLQRAECLAGKHKGTSPGQPSTASPSQQTPTTSDQQAFPDPMQQEPAGTDQQEPQSSEMWY